MNFSWENFVLKFFRPKGAQNGPKLKLFKIGGKSVDGTFPIFFMKLQQHKDLKLT